MDTKRTMNDLPTEIKARIVELCAEQDERFGVWEDQLRKHGRISSADNARTTHLNCKRTVSALFLVSREWSSFAAPALFKVFKASKANFTFKSAVAPRHAHLFRQVVFDTNAQAKLEDAFVALSQLTKVNKVVLENVAVKAMWRFGTVALEHTVGTHSSLSAFAGPAIRRLLNQTVELTLKDVHLSAISAFLAPAAASLRVLDLQLTPNGSPFDEVGAALKLAVHLTDLSISTSQPYATGHILNLSTLVSALVPVPPIQRLSISAHYLHDSHLALASVCRGTLEELSLRSCPPYDDYLVNVPQPRFQAHAFPFVSKLVLAGDEDLIGNTLSSIETRHFPTLDTLELDIPYAEDWFGTDVSLLTPFEPFTFLATLRIPNLAGLPPNQREDIDSFCDEHGIALEGSPRPALPPTTTSAACYTAPDLAKKVTRTVDFVAEEIKAAEARQDETRLSSLHSKLHEFEQERLVAELWKAA
ncbi:hypothetical protein JCM10207_000784 [Rhodosporidiobolus poonsookiae]